MISADPVGWEHFHHQADIGVRGFGPTLDAAFEQAAKALTAVISTSVIRPEKEYKIYCEADDLEALLVDWLNELIYHMATDNYLFGSFKVEITGTSLSGIIWGEPLNRTVHQPVVEVKAATYTELKVSSQDPQSWVAQCVVDV